MEEKIKNAECIMIANFIKVMDIISKYKSIEEVREDIDKRKKEYLQNLKQKDGETEFFNLCLDENFIDEKVQTAKQIYSKSTKINEVYLAYKLGLLDGMKVKSE
ncbi:MAG: hypothetical protein IKF38_05660 [Clostridia bacterium]|nr:hypothetical protein [Clostridia bacterium]